MTAKKPAKTMAEKLEEKKAAPAAEEAKPAPAVEDTRPPGPHVPGPMPEPQRETERQPSMAEKVHERRRLKTEMRVETRIQNATKHPSIIAGMVEDEGVPPEQSKYYEGVDIRCTYCGEGEKIMKERTFRVFSLPANPDTLIIVCDDYGCEAAHNKRFNVGSVKVAA